MMRAEGLVLVQEWDKVFPQDERVEHCKVTFANRYGITPASPARATSAPPTASRPATGSAPPGPPSGPQSTGRGNMSAPAAWSTPCPRTRPTS